MSAAEKFVVVAPEGNKRLRSMTATEISQCVLDIATWFSSHAKEAGIDDIPGASESALAGLEAHIPSGASLPPSLPALLQRADGGFLLREFTLLSTETIAKVVASESASDTWPSPAGTYLPFGRDLDDNLIGLRYAASEGKGAEGEASGTACVAEWSRDEGLGPQVSPSFEDWIESFRNDLLASKFEFMEDAGLVEKVGPSSPVKTGKK